MKMEFPDNFHISFMPVHLDLDPSGHARTSEEVILEVHQKQIGPQSHEQRNCVVYTLQAAVMYLHHKILIECQMHSCRVPI